MIMIGRKDEYSVDVYYFRDKLFDLLNDSEDMGIADLNADEKRGVLLVETTDGDQFEIRCRSITGQKNEIKFV